MHYSYPLSQLSIIRDMPWKLCDFNEEYISNHMHIRRIIGLCASLLIQQEVLYILDHVCSQTNNLQIYIFLNNIFNHFKYVSKYNRGWYM